MVHHDNTPAQRAEQDSERRRARLRRPEEPPRHGVVTRAVDLLFPPVCLACRTPLADPDSLCAACWSGIDFIRPPLCDRLGIPLPFDTGGRQISGAAAADPPGYDRARAVATYGPVMQRLVHALKYHDRHDGRRLFGRWMVNAGAELIDDADVIVPIPLHPWRLLSRKFNQSAILAREIARSTGIALAPAALARVKRTAQQVGMTADERRRNVAGAFAVPRVHRHRVTGRRVLLVDDVITTGATCRAATLALKRAGAVDIDVLALALVSDTVG